MTSDAAVTSPWKVMVPVESVRVRTPAVTEPVKVALLELATVRSPDPAKDATVVLAEEPLSRVSPWPWLVTAPRVRPAEAPLPVCSVVSAASVTGPRSIAVLVVCTVPASRTVPVTAVVSSPPAKVAESPAASPIDSVPPMAPKVVSESTVTAPRSDRLYPPAAVVRVVRSTTPSTRTVPVVAVIVSVLAVTASRVAPPVLVRVTLPEVLMAPSVTPPRVLTTRLPVAPMSPA